MGGSIDISVSGASSYTWDDGLGTGNTKTVTPTSDTIYSVTGTDGNGCTDVTQINITVKPQTQ